MTTIQKQLATRTDRRIGTPKESSFVDSMRITVRLSVIRTTPPINDAAPIRVYVPGQRLIRKPNICGCQEFRYLCMAKTKVNYSFCYRQFASKLLLRLPKNYGNKSPVCCPNQKTRNEDASRNACSMSPTSNEEICNEQNPKSGQRKGTYDCIYTHIPHHYHENFHTVLQYIQSSLCKLYIDFLTVLVKQLSDGYFWRVEHQSGHVIEIRILSSWRTKVVSCLILECKITLPKNIQSILYIQLHVHL